MHTNSVGSIGLCLFPLSSENMLALKYIRPRIAAISPKAKITGNNIIII